MRARLLVAALALVVLAPAASAHETMTTTDGKYRVVFGQLLEPVITYSKTGLDLCFTQNDEARTPVTPEIEKLTVTLNSPSGQTLTEPLRAQFGRAGCYQFANAYMLTEPGQYTLDVQGDLLGTPVDFKAVKAGGVVGAVEDLTFPNRDILTNAELDAQKADGAEVASLKAQITSLQAELATLRTQVQQLEGNQSEDAPFPAGILVVAVLLALVALRRR